MNPDRARRRLRPTRIQSASRSRPELIENSSRMHPSQTPSKMHPGRAQTHPRCIQITDFI
eukprot:5860836-Lingulodinium_polyedra.AAC.1